MRTTTFHNLIFIVFVIALASTGCTTTKQATGAQKASTDTPYQWESEGTIPPLGADDVAKQVDEVDTFEEVAVEESVIAVEDVEEPLPDPDLTATDSTLTVAGYRVQIFASGSRESAETVRAQASHSTGQTAYIDIDGGVYKVRVGDCASRADAEALRDTCRSAGYEDAWIVAAQVVVQRSRK